MKLRLRSLETKQTHRIEIPDSSSLQLLKETLLETLNANPNQNQNENPSSSSLIGNLHLSLNRKDELRSESSDGDATILQSLGITSGDLIFFTLNPFGFASSSENLISTQAKIEPTPIVSGNPLSTPTSAISAQVKETQNQRSMETDQKLTLDGDLMELVGDHVDDDDVEEDMSPIAKSFSVPGFLRKVFTEELGDDGGRDHKLVVLAIHAVLLDSGFVTYDALAKEMINGFQVQKEWPLGLLNLRLYYTLPEIVNCAPNSTHSIETVCLKFHSLGKSVTAYGSLVNANESSVYRVNFNEDKLVPFLNVVWANCGLKDEVSFDAQGSETSAEKEVFNFWRRVKDEMALPLLIDLCEKAGFGLPACFMMLPTEIKLKILDVLPGVDVARVSCVCSELRYLASSDELWKKKCKEQFADGQSGEDSGNWKRKFVQFWEGQKRRRVHRRQSIHRVFQPRMPRIIGGAHDIWPHLPMIGGDYDRLPQQYGPLGGGRRGGGLALGRRMPPLRRHQQSIQVPRCSLGGSGSMSLFPDDE